VPQPSESTANGHTLPTRSPNRRAWVRYHYEPEAPGQLFNRDTSDCRPAQVVNLSGGGLGLVLEDAFPVGTLLKVELEGRHGPRLLGARVVHVSESAGLWLHGCELAHPLPKGEMEDLLE
jgi:hypothetical protein